MIEEDNGSEMEVDEIELEETSNLVFEANRGNIFNFDFMVCVITLQLYTGAMHSAHTSAMHVLCVRMLLCFKASAGVVFLLSVLICFRTMMMNRTL